MNQVMKKIRIIKRKITKMMMMIKKIKRKRRRKKKGDKVEFENKEIEHIESLKKRMN